MATPISSLDSNHPNVLGIPHQVILDEYFHNSAMCRKHFIYLKKHNDSLTTRNALQFYLLLGARQIVIDSEIHDLREFGIALREMIDSRLVSREELTIFLKVPVTKPGQLTLSLYHSLTFLQLEFVDFYLSTIGPNFRRIVEETGKLENYWKEIDTAKDLGLLRKVGVSEWNDNEIHRVLELDIIRPVFSEFAEEPVSSAKEHYEMCFRENIVTFSLKYSRVLEGIPEESDWDSTSAISPFHHSFLPFEERFKPYKMAQQIGTKYQKSHAQIIVAYLLNQKSLVGANVCQLRLRANFGISSTFKLSKRDKEKLETARIDQLIMKEKYSPNRSKTCIIQ